MSEQPDHGAAPATAPPPLAALKRGLNALDDEARGRFFPAVAELLSSSPALPASAQRASMKAAFGLDFDSSKEADALLHAAKLLTCRVASAAYAEEGASAALHADLRNAGLAEAAAAWVREAAETAVRPIAADIRLAQARAAANLSHTYLHDFDWALYHVLGSSTISRVQEPLVQVQLSLGKGSDDAGGVVLRTESLELTPSDLDATIGALASASDALRKLPSPGGA